MRVGRELAALVALLVVLGALVRSGAGRFVLPVLALALAAGLAWLLTRTPAYPRTAVGPRTRLMDAPADADVACVECDAPATVRRRFVREWVVLGVPVLLLGDGTNYLCDDHLD